jgi:hypothetical protein
MADRKNTADLDRAEASCGTGRRDALSELRLRQAVSLTTLEFERTEATKQNLTVTSRSRAELARGGDHYFLVAKS